MSYRIGSFNIQKFSGRSNKDFSVLAKIIIDARFDIVALQEVFDVNAVRDLTERHLRRYNSEWAYRWDCPRDSSEGYAFLWNTKTIELSSTTDSNNRKRIAEPAIYNQYPVDKGMPKLIRNPYYGRFKPKDCNCEFRLINVHLRYSADKEFGLTAKVTRENELKILAESLYHRISDKRYGNYLPQYTIMLGDFNLSLPESNAAAPYISPIRLIYDNGKIQTLQIVQKELTTLKEPDQKQPNLSLPPAVQGAMVVIDELKRENDYFKSNYDHFVYDKERFAGIAKDPKRIDTVAKYTEKDIKEHRDKISDHVPISMNLKLNSNEIDEEKKNLMEELYGYQHHSQN